MNIPLIIFIVVVIIIIIRIKKRGFFWKDKKGKELTFKQFKGRFKEGVINTSPLQQTRITLFAFIPMFAGITWGIVVTFLLKTYWLTLILSGSLPITSIQFLSNVQKYRSQKAAEKLMKEAEEYHLETEFIKVNKRLRRLVKKRYNTEVKLTGKQRKGMSTMAMTTNQYIKKKKGERK